MKRFVGLCLAAFLASLSALAAAAPDTLAKIKRTGTITIAYSPGALPFSFKDEVGKPAGYSVDICRRIVAGLQSQLKIPELKTRWIAANTPGRLKVVAEGKADIECGTTTVTLSRQEKVDFSNFVFVELGGVLVKSDKGIERLTHLGDKKIAVTPGTTTEKRLKRTLLGQLVRAKFVPIEEPAQGMKLLDAGKVDAYAGDRLVLIGQAAASKDRDKLSMLTEQFSIDPYAFALPRGDADFRLAVNEGLAHLYRTREIEKIFVEWFGPNAEPSTLLRAVYFLYAFAD